MAEMIRMACAIASDWRISGLERDDLRSIAQEAAVRAVRAYRPGVRPLGAYVAIMVRRRLTDAARTAATRRARAASHKADLNSVSVTPSYELALALHHLTDQQRYCCELLAMGYSEKETALALKVKRRGFLKILKELRQFMAEQGFGLVN